MSDAASSGREKICVNCFCKSFLSSSSAPPARSSIYGERKQKQRQFSAAVGVAIAKLCFAGRNKLKLAESKVEIELHLVELLRADGEKHIRHTAARSRQEKCQGHSCYNFSLCAQFNFSNRAQEKRSPKASETSRFAIPPRCASSSVDSHG